MAQQADGLGHIWTPATQAIAGLLDQGGAQTRLVGGPVRDSLLGIVPKDLDLCTTATPMQMLELADRHGMRTIPMLSELADGADLGLAGGGLKHGTVSFVVDSEVYEVTTLRQDTATDGRHAQVEFVSDFRADALRRDFTINAMSVDRDGVLHDYFGGLDDLRAGIVRFVGDADARIREDYLRILRYYRFQARFAHPQGQAGPVDEHTAQAIQRNAPGLSRLSGERIWQEMSRILAMPSAIRDQFAAMVPHVSHHIGLPAHAVAMRRADLAATSGARPEVVLGMLLSQAEGMAMPGQPHVSAASLQAHWKYSNEVAELVELTRTRADQADRPLSWFIQAALEPRARPDYLAALLVGMGRADDARVLSSPLPRFPLTGADIVARGMRPGPEVGASLATLRQEWVDSGYAATRTELLESFEARTQPQQRPGL